jgi:hypothetical protein
MNLLNVPFGKISTTLGTSLKYVDGHAAKMAIGAAIGGAAAYTTGNSTLGGAALGAVGGLAYGKGYHNLPTSKSTLGSVWSDTKAAISNDWNVASAAWEKGTSTRNITPWSR